MSIDRSISIATVRNELLLFKSLAETLGIVISEINEVTMSFTVVMVSSLDKEKYELDVQFDNYPAWPLLLDFIDPITREKGTKRAYPMGKGSFFHQKLPCICNPCSRKAYKEFHPGAPHGNWKFIGWQQNPEVWTLTNIPAILQAIHFRINNTNYYEQKRMG